MHRNIQERVEKIAPFLTYDDDPYLVISEGKLYWIIDAYTMSNKYPYSEPISHQKYQGINYIRNSVKVIIDAYNGTVDYYITDEKDPIILTYANIFPDLFKPLELMPQGLREHLRYPIDILNLQTLVFQNYHMTNPGVFYNREDAWNVAKENYQGNIQALEPYYINMTLPSSDKLEFLLMRPLLINKDNMISGWLPVTVINTAS